MHVVHIDRFCSDYISDFSVGSLLAITSAENVFVSICLMRYTFCTLYFSIFSCFLFGTNSSIVIIIYYSVVITLKVQMRISLKDGSFGEVNEQ